MTKLIAHRKELMALEESTLKFSKIGLCKSLGDYWKLIAESRKVYEAISTNKYSSDEWKGLVFGEPFLNYWLYKMGANHGIYFDSISTRAEDGHGVDAWARDATTEERFAINHKTFSYGVMVLREHTAGIAWAAVRYGDRPMIVTTSNEVSIPVRDDVKAAKGIVITRDHIEPSVKNQIFWKEFEEYLLLNHTEYTNRQKDAEIAAATKSTRPLEDWQAIDLGILLS